MHEIGIESSLVEAIRSGEKTIEGQLGKPEVLKIQAGDTLSIREDIWKDGRIIGSHDDTLRATVTQVLYFESFKEMMGVIDYEAAVPTATSMKAAVNTYAQFYSAEDEAEYGVVALFLKVNEQE